MKDKSFLGPYSALDLEAKGAERMRCARNVVNVVRTEQQ